MNDDPLVADGDNRDRLYAEGALGLSRHRRKERFQTVDAGVVPLNVRKLWIEEVPHEIVG